ncbi:MAG: hypothetical protein P8M05_07340, partial [Flavobacteriales bacterium]|nr:hypothetical protein [Flavobacteriales bacterium]
MLQTLFRKKKYTEDTLANVFVNNLITSVDASFEDVADLLKSDSEFETTPHFSSTDSDRFLMVVIVGNLNFLSRYFSTAEEQLLRKCIVRKLAKV